VHPAYRGNGLDDFVFEWAEARGRAKLGDMPFDFPRLLRTGIQDDLHDRIALVEQHGFRPARYFYRMRRDLSQPIPEGAPPEGITLRTYSPELSQGMLQAFNESFADHWALSRSPQATGHVLSQARRLSPRPDVRCAARRRRW